jgi:glycosyltransferase involved in cell wall biosynthesis
MCHHDILVSPSLAETFGFPLVEAMGLGMPIVVADTPIHREICGDAALYFAPGSSHELCDRVLELDCNPALRQRCSELGKARVRANFVWNKHMSSLVGCFRQVAP